MENFCRSLRPSRALHVEPQQILLMTGKLRDNRCPQQAENPCRPRSGQSQTGLPDHGHAGWLLERWTANRPGRVHDGKIIVMRSNLRWCSDAFEITCWNTEVVRVVFLIDAFDREIIGWDAVANQGVSGSMVREPHRSGSYL